MYIKRITILSLLFIFGVIIQMRADTIKSINITAYQGKTIKIDENEYTSNSSTQIPIIKEGSSATLEESGREAFKTLKKLETRFQSGNSYKACEASMGNAKFEVNLFLKSPEGKKELKLADSIDKVISHYKFDQNLWRHQFLGYRGITETKSLNSEFGQSILGLYPRRNEDFEKRGTLATFKLLNSKRAEIFTEIFMLFHLTFNPKGKHIFLEINSTPFSEEGKSFFIQF